MAIQIGAKLESDYTDPLGMMSDCHRRIERLLEQFIRVVEWRGRNRLGESERAILEAALRYFRSGAPTHTADEEKSLFPRLRRLDSREADAVLEGLARLESDHRAAEEAHLEVDKIGRRWLVEVAISEEELRCIRNHLHALRVIYRAHIAYEEQELFPLARRMLDSAEIEEIAREMADRRGLDYDSLLQAPRPSRRNRAV